MTAGNLRPTWAEIDLGAVAHNLATLRGLVGPGVAIFVCLKGDAFGCGAPAVGRQAERSGADGLAFGNVDSALACRRAGIALPLLVYPSVLPQAAPVLEAHDLMPTLSTLEEVAVWSGQVRRRMRVFLKVDAGGFRAGALPHHAAAVARAIADDPRLELAGVYGHPMASYGFLDEPYTRSQIAGFQVALSAIGEAGVRAPLRMVSSSAILLEHPEADLNAVDPGRLVVGIRFPAVAQRQREWRPALVGLKSRLVMVKPLDAVGGVQPAPFLALRPGMRLGLIPFGWGDGYPHQIPPKAQALVRGRRVALLGPPHSELLRVDLTDVPDARVGDEVVLLGRSGGDAIGLSELAAQWGVEEFDVYGAIRSLPKRYGNADTNEWGDGE